MSGAINHAHRYCRACLYDLHGIDRDQCPECGRAFDAHDARTTLPWPRRVVWHRLGVLARVLTKVSVVLAIVAFGLCVLGFDRPRTWHYFSCGFGFGLIVLAIVLALLPMVPLSRRGRVACLAAPLLYASIDWTHWPLLASVYVCPPWAEMIADRAEASGKARGMYTPSFMGFRRGKALGNGTVGFQLVGGDGGGIYLVRSAALLPLGPNRVWINTSWEKSIGGNWHLVFED